MLEVGKTYSWADFWKYCKIGETYKITILKEASDFLPILDPNEQYLYYDGGHSGYYLLKATEFISAFNRLFGDKAKEIIEVDCSWYGVADYAELSDRDRIEIPEDIVYETMEAYGVERKETFENDFLRKLPGVECVTDYYGDSCIELDLESCAYFGNVGDYTIKIKSKKGDWEIESIDERKGIIGGNDQNFWGLFNDVQVTVNDIV